jgi:hypothetical protein
MRVNTLLLGTALFAFSAFSVSAVAQESRISDKAVAPAGVLATSSAKNVFGQPDLGGYWTNVTLTPLTRDPKFAGKAALTAAEAKDREQTFAAALEARDAIVSDTNSLPGNAEDKAKDAQLIAARSDFAGAGGAVGGYNTYWLDPGTQILEINGEYRTSILTTPNGQFPPRKADAPKTAAARPPGGEYESYENRPLNDRCISFARNAPPPMLPNGYYNNNYQILQTADAVLIQIEHIHDVRIVRLAGGHRKDGLRPWNGDSVGRYEGNTLVVETTNIPQAQAFAGSWKNLKVTERFTRTSPTTMLYQFEIDDPDMWDKPWGGEYTFHPLKGVIYEYACHEGNYAMSAILGGARNLERRGQTP